MDGTETGTEQICFYCEISSLQNIQQLVEVGTTARMWLVESQNGVSGCWGGRCIELIITELQTSRGLQVSVDEKSELCRLGFHGPAAETKHTSQSTKCWMQECKHAASCLQSSDTYSLERWSSFPVWQSDGRDYTVQSLVERGSWKLSILDNFMLPQFGPLAVPTLVCTCKW